MSEDKYQVVCNFGEGDSFGHYEILRDDAEPDWKDGMSSVETGLTFSEAKKVAIKHAMSDVREFKSRLAAVRALRKVDII